MAYFFGFAILGLIFIVLHFFTDISLKQKFGTVIVLGLFILGAYLFNLSTEERRLHLEEVLIEFTQGQHISCNSFDVSSQLFSYSSGTQTFIGLKDTNMSGRLISLDSCK